MRVGSFARCVFKYNFYQFTEDIDESCKCLRKGVAIGNYVIRIIHSLIAKYFNSQTIHYELSIILECIFYQLHRSLAIKLIDLRAQQIERVGRARLVSARAIAHISLKDLQAVNSLTYCSYFSDWKLSDNSGEKTGGGGEEWNLPAFLICLWSSISSLSHWHFPLSQAPPLRTKE